MLMVKHEAEFRMMDMLKGIFETRSSWRAQTYRLSLLKEQLDLNNLEKIVFGIINNTLAECEGSTFFCHDRDVVIVCKAATKRVFDEITTEILSHIPDKAKNLLDAFSQTSDLGVSIETFRQFVQSKLNSVTAKTETDGSSISESITVKNHSHTSTNTKASDILSIRLSRTRTRVLLVEDDALSLHLAKKSLMLDFDVVTADNGATAQSAYVLHAPDVVFLDIGLPDTTGHDVLKTILKLDPTAYIVMLSGNSYKEDIMKAMQGGAKGFVGKPFSKTKLFQYISQCPTHHELATAQ